MRQRGRLDAHHARDRRLARRRFRRRRPAAFLRALRSGVGERLARIESQPEAWFEAGTTFFDVNPIEGVGLDAAVDALGSPSRAADVSLRLWGHALYSTYGPSADTGGLFRTRRR